MSDPLPACTKMSFHCWHKTGRVKLSNPPIIEVICCFCAVKTMYYENRSKTLHGDYTP